MSHCDVTCCVHMNVFVCVCVCVCVCVGGGGGGGTDSAHETSATDQLADLCSDSFPAFLVLQPAVVE